MPIFLITLGCSMAAFALCAPRAAAEEPVPVRLGIAYPGSYLMEQAHIPPWTHPPFFEALDELGAKVVCVPFFPVTNAGERNAEETAKAIQAIDAAMCAHGLEYMLDVEISNFVERMEITPGVNEFAHPGGTHRWDLRMEWLTPVLAPVLAPAHSGNNALLSITYDEVEHMILSNNKFANTPRNDFDAPYWLDTRGMPLTEAYDRLVAAAVETREHYENRVPPQSEQVWPDLFHVFARAGWIITPKLLKEHLSSVVMACALGAAVQYKDVCKGFWVSPDLWNCDMYPGHSPEALGSALLMGYWLGAETIYVENLDYQGIHPRHPRGGTKGSLIAWDDPDHWALTPYGGVFRTFTKTYVPSHPRSINWRDYDPRVAIIRLPDGGWGQFSAENGHGEAASRNRLLGNRDMPLDEAASEWLHVWPILTHGAARPGAISSNNPFVYPNKIEEFFVPIDSVAVFDHNVAAPALANVDCMVVCGHALSADSFAAIRARVEAGATCIIARLLYDTYASAPLPGKWTIVDDFRSPELGIALQPHLGPPDVARFRFKNQTVEFRKTGQKDAVEVKVTER